MTLDEVTAEIGEMGWSCWSGRRYGIYKWTVAKPIGYNAEVRYVFWADTVLDAAEAALKWLKERGE